MILDKKYIFKLIVGLMIYNLVILNASSAAPYPPSPIFESIEWDFSTHKRTASGSDLWATTWAADGNLYSTWGDGGGFGGDDSKGRVYLGVARIEGSGTSWAGYNVFGGYNGEVSADFIGKANSIISVDGSLYISVTEEGKWQRSKIGRSDDNGKTWVFNNGSFANSSWDFAETGGAFSGPSYIQFGKDNSGALDNYIYLYSRKTKTSSETEMLLARVDKTKIQVRSAYEFYSGIDENGAPLWTSDLSLAKSVFTDSQNGVNWGHASFYHPIYKRYILTMRQNDSNGGRTGAWGIYDAPNPWGPWTTIAFYTDWDAGTPFEGASAQILYNIPTKWIGVNGLEFHMIFSISDSFNVIKGRFIERGSTPIPQAPKNVKVQKTQ